ncbi:bifunctional protein GlmU-like isoform X3 [Cryptotermes secundus]|nr:bifunctional protein GlmU-like isoform X3 [Cryptotermes secundus]XP_023707669.1 bifunctional protein GlmU-like isoform X3 [Cryptotermes secundus]XP_023707670.1 bifunctional protein GlmU-like isoform X3 [Cryptotermes secundus]XP_023707671.1 bifunctional protein GlmU-like isoform X3 [Cryptotermes secundus]XP_033607374.1 bifunctional protein GlmU-like isoform X3 [Cryptotermes secundus]
MCENSMKVYPMRLQPGTEIKSSLVEFVTSRQLNAAFVLTCCGSVIKATLRFATCPDQTHQIHTLNKCFEITSLVGTICKDGAHLHITLGDSDGNTVAGHVVGDLIVQTTAEIVLGEVCDVQFKREFDKATGFPELVISKHEMMK